MLKSSYISGKGSRKRYPNYGNFQKSKSQGPKVVCSREVYIYTGLQFAFLVYSRSAGGKKAMLFSILYRFVNTRLKAIRQHHA